MDFIVSISFFFNFKIHKCFIMSLHMSSLGTFWRCSKQIAIALSLTRPVCRLLCRWCSGESLPLVRAVRRRGSSSRPPRGLLLLSFFQNDVGEDVSDDGFDAAALMAACIGAPVERLHGETAPRDADL